MSIERAVRSVFMDDALNSRPSAPSLLISPDTYASRQPHGTHARLWLDRYLPFQECKAEPQEQKQTAPQQEDPKKNPRFQHIRAVADIPIPAIYSDFYRRWKEQLKQSGAQCREARAKGRLILGLGGASVLETSIALHHTYGVPYIPGSALKGLAASYLRWQFGENWREDDKKLQQYNTIFGTTEDAGYITFFDALYIPGRAHKGHPLQQDVITVHHPDYYKGTEKAGQRAKPTDLDNPTPIPLLSATGSYLLALAAPDLDETHERGQWLEATFTLLNTALQHWGIGARTSSGYGRMIIVSNDESAEKAEDAQEEKNISPEAQACIERIDSLGLKFNQDIHLSYKDWQQLQSEEDRLLIARTIIERIEQRDYTRLKSKKDWYQDLVRFVQAQQENEPATPPA